MAEEIVTKYMNDEDIPYIIKQIFDVLVRKLRLHNMIDSSKNKFDIEAIEHLYNLAIECAKILDSCDKIVEYCIKIEEDIMLNLVKYTTTTTSG